MANSNTPLKLEGSEGDLKEFSSTEENYLAYQASLNLSVDSGGDDVPGILSLDSNSSLLIGSLVNSFFNESVGTHPGSSISSGTTTTNLYQKQGIADEDSATYRRPIGYLNSGSEGVYEMDDSDFNSLCNRLNSRIVTSDYPGIYKLASSSPGGDYSIHIANVFTDTRTDGTSVQYNIYRRTSMSPPTKTKSLCVRKTNGDSGDFLGLQEMTDDQIRYSLGQRCKTLRAVGGQIGSYQLRSSSEGSPTDPGTWVSKGTASDTKNDTVETSYTRTRNSSFTRTSTADFTRNFIGDFTGNYSRTFVGNYTRTFVGNYTGDFIGNYSRNFVGNYTRSFLGNYIGDFTGNFIGDFIGNYTRSFLGNFTGNYSRNFVGNYSRSFAGNYTRISTRTSTVNYIGNYSRNFQGNYIGTSTFTRTRSQFFGGVEGNVAFYTGNYSRIIDYVGDYTVSFAGNYIGNYVGEFTGDFIGNYAVNFTRTRVSSFTRNSTRNRVSSFTRNIQFDFTRNSVNSFSRNRVSSYARTRVSSYSRNSTRTSTRNRVSAYTRNRVSSYTRNSTRVRVSSFIGNFVGNYSRGFVGNYVGTTIDSNASTVETYTLYARAA